MSTTWRATPFDAGNEKDRLWFHAAVRSSINDLGLQKCECRSIKDVSLFPLTLNTEGMAKVTLSSTPVFSEDVVTILHDV